MNRFHKYKLVYHHCDKSVRMIVKYREPLIADPYREDSNDLYRIQIQKKFLGISY